MPARRVLFVEDDEAIRDFYLMFVARLLPGVAAEAVGRGREALERVARGGVDLVVCDLRLPDMDGGALARALADHPGSRALPVLLVSGGHVPGELLALPNVAGFLGKPFGPERLVHRIASLLHVAAPAPAASGRPGA